MNIRDIFLKKIGFFEEKRIVRSVLIAFLCILSSIALYAARGGIKTSVEIHRFERDTGHAYKMFHPLLKYSVSDVKDNRSNLKVFEDGKVLGPPHMLHQDIRDLGGGGYSHWKNTVYFSTSDNTDPAANNRTYHIRFSLFNSYGYFFLILVPLAFFLRKEIFTGMIFLKSIFSTGFLSSPVLYTIFLMIAGTAIVLAIYKSLLFLLLITLPAVYPARRKLYKALKFSVNFLLSRSLVFYVISFVVFGFIVPLTIYLVLSLHTDKTRVLEIDFKSINNETGFAYYIKYPSYGFLRGGFDASDVVLLEDGVLLPTQNALHDSIRKVGKGAYSFWFGTLYFSTSDNSDPRMNGRSYTISGIYRSRFNLKTISPYFILFLGLVLTFIAGRIAPFSQKLYVCAGIWISVLVVFFPLASGATIFDKQIFEKRLVSNIAGDKLWNSTYYTYDSADYVNNDPRRTPIYPFFIRHVIDIKPEYRGYSCYTQLPQDPEQHPFIPITRAQITLFIVCVAFLGIVATRHITVWASYLLAVVIVFFATDPINQLSHVMTEGILFPELIIITGVLIMVVEKPSVMRSFVLGIFFSIAFLTNPRALFFFPVLLVPAAVLFVKSRKILSVFYPAAFTGPLVAFLCFLSISTVNKYRYNQFALVPFGGDSSISLALQFADPMDYKLFEDPNLSFFVKSALDSLAKSPWVFPPNDVFVAQINVHIFRPLSDKVVKSYIKGEKGDYWTGRNEIAKQVSRKLIPLHYDRVLKWSLYIFKKVGRDWNLSYGGHYLWLFITIISIFFIIYYKDSLSILGFFLIVTHYFSMIVSSTLQGISVRYITSTSWFLPYACALLCISAVHRLWKYRI